MLDLEKTLKILGEKAQNMDSWMAEATTKHALLLPFLYALGYNVFDSEEVVPDFKGSRGKSQEAPADYTIMREGHPFIVVECKTLGTPLEPFTMQVKAQMFNAGVQIGILTDGNHYLFFVDLDCKLAMDDFPYLDFTLSELDLGILPYLGLLAKERYDEQEFFIQAKYLKSKKLN
ncbi:MAG: hypothetical protein IJU40_05835 [Desulfovibrionaceae bacterium]|nr:hypothetical protein [Desulfovibrionaceae bacterium]